MKKMILSAALLFVSTLSFAQLNTTGVKYQANQRTKKVRMVVPDTVKAEKEFQKNLGSMQEKLAQQEEEVKNAKNLQSKIGKKLKDSKDVETLKKVNEYNHPGTEFTAPKKISKSLTSDINQYTEHVENQYYNTERDIRSGWQGTEYAQKEYSTTIDNEYYRGNYFGDAEQLDKFDFEYQIKGHEDKLKFDENGKLLQNDQYDKRGRLTYVASLLRTDQEVMKKIRSLVAARNKKANLDEVLGCVYIIERVSNTSFRVVYYNSRTKKASYAALVSYRTAKANKKTFTVSLTTIPKNLPAVN